MKVIEIIVSPGGQSRVETRGFAGPECRRASEFVETALGRSQNEQLTTEFYQQSSERQTLDEGASR